MNAPIAFTKMHGLGNDFMVVDNTAGDVVLEGDRIRRLADRHTGVGFDQLLVVERASREGAAFDYRIHNADGDEVEHCGNGARCFARFVVERGLTDAREIVVNTRGGLITLALRGDGEVSVDMGVPTFVPERIPFVADAEAADGRYRIDVDGETLVVGAVAIGNPHVVLVVPRVAGRPRRAARPRARVAPALPAARQRRLRRGPGARRTAPSRVRARRRRDPCLRYRCLRRRRDRSAPGPARRAGAGDAARRRARRPSRVRHRRRH